MVPGGRVRVRFASKKCYFKTEIQAEDQHSVSPGFFVLRD